MFERERAGGRGKAEGPEGRETKNRQKRTGRPAYLLQVRVLVPVSDLYAGPEGPRLGVGARHVGKIVAAVTCGRVL